MGLLGSMKQADSGGSEHPQPEAMPLTSADAGTSTRSVKSKSAEGTIPQRFGKILRDADGNVVGVELPEETDEEEPAKETDMPVEDITDLGQTTEVVDGALLRDRAVLATWLFMA